jgi:hypothetical protein
MEIKKSCENCRNLLDCFHKLNVLMVAKESELQQYKEALRLACERICFHGHSCPAELIANFDAFECRDTCDVVGQKPFDCWVKYFLTQAKGG